MEGRRKVSVLLLSIILLLSVQPQNIANAGIRVPVDDTLRKQILNATILISVLAPADQGQKQAGASTKPEGYETIVMTKLDGLGTLVQAEGERWIVTHNHWGGLVERMSIARFYNAGGELLLAMSGDEFRGLIRFRDKGTMVLQAPEALTATSPADHETPSPAPTGAEMPKEGATVFFIHPKIGQEGQFEVLPAYVASINVDGIPTLKVHTPNGVIIRGGNSGGGVWFNGHYIGNVWATVLRTEISGSTFQSEESLTNESYVALFNLGMVQE